MRYPHRVHLAIPVRDDALPDAPPRSYTATWFRSDKLEARRRERRAQDRREYGSVPCLRIDGETVTADVLGEILALVEGSRPTRGQLTVIRWGTARCTRRSADGSVEWSYETEYPKGDPLEAARRLREIRHRYQTGDVPPSTDMETESFDASALPVTYWRVVDWVLTKGPLDSELKRWRDLAVEDAADAEEGFAAADVDAFDAVAAEHGNLPSRVRTPEALAPWLDWCRRLEETMGAFGSLGAIGDLVDPEIVHGDAEHWNESIDDHIAARVTNVANQVGVSYSDPVVDAIRAEVPPHDVFELLERLNAWDAIPRRQQ